MSKYVGDLTTVVRGRRLTRLALTSAVWIVFASHTTIFSQAIKQRSHDVENGERIYKSGCIACHGGDGRGAPETLTEFERPDTFPDFTRCDQTTPESKW
jgi:cytochrome c